MAIRADDNLQFRAGLHPQYSVLSTQYSVRRIAAALLFTAAILTCLPHPSATAAPSPDDSDDEQAVQTAKEALASGGKFPWYDRANDDVRRLNMRPRQSMEECEATWTDTKTRTTRTPRAAPRVTFLGNILQWIGLTTLVILLGLIAYLIATAFLKDELSEDAVAVRKVVESRRDAD